MSLERGLFDDLNSFQQGFRQGLTQILQQPGLGAFILACANVNNQHDLQESMADDIDRQYRLLKARFMSAETAAGSPEDRQVFQSLMALRLENLPVTERRQLGPWSVQHNTMRGFRPMRHASESPSRLLLPFDTYGFSFNKDFMLQEMFWQGQWRGHGLSAYYNKFPFADYHLLWVPDREQAHSQYLQPVYHHLIWELLQELAPVLPGFALGYSSIGACASVNHLHFQSYLGEPLTVTKSNWKHNGGSDDYPLQVFVFQQPEAAWHLIEQLHQQNQPYNLLYGDNAIYCLPRQLQGSIALPDWSAGFAWREMSGEMLSMSREAYLNLTRQELESALAQWRVEL